MRSWGDSSHFLQSWRRPMSPRESAGPLLTTHPGSPPQPSSARSPSFLQRAWSASSPSCYCMQKGWVQPSIPIPLGAWQPQLPWTPGQPSCTLALYTVVTGCPTSKTSGSAQGSVGLWRNVSRLKPHMGQIKPVGMSEKTELPNISAQCRWQPRRRTHTYFPKKAWTHFE